MRISVLMVILLVSASSVFAQFPDLPDPIVLISKPNDVKVTSSIDSTIVFHSNYLFYTNNSDTTKINQSVDIKVSGTKLTIFHVENYSLQLSDIAIFYRNEKMTHISSKSDEKFIEISIEGQWVKITSNDAEIIYYR